MTQENINNQFQLQIVKLKHQCKQPYECKYCKQKFTYYGHSRKHIETRTKKNQLNTNIVKRHLINIVIRRDDMKAKDYLKINCVKIDF